MEYLKDCDVAWLLGVIAGDGHVDRYFVEISDRHKENLEVVGEAVSKLGYKYVITKDLRENRYRLWVNSKKFVNFLISELGYSPSLKIPQKTFNKLCFTQGLYDAEGYVEYWKPRNAVRINFANKSAAVIDLVLSALKNAGITKPYVRHTSRAYRIQIYRKKDVETYAAKIGFRYPTKRNKLALLLF